MRKWHPSTAGITVGIGAVALIALALGAGRPDIGALAIPLAAVVVWGTLARPRGGLGVRRGAVGTGPEPGRLSATIEIDTPAGADAVHLRLSAPGYRTTEALVAAGSRRITASIDTVRTGRAQVFPLDAYGVGADGVTRSEPVTQAAASVLLTPRMKALSEMPLPFRLQGLTGAHGSPRIGDGGDIRDVNVFTPGDRLRRIDWRVTARRAAGGAAAASGQRIGDIYVRRTFAVADATVILVIDSRDEVGPEVSSWSEWRPPRPDQLTSLDLMREAAASVARQFLDGGDRVGMHDLGRKQPSVAPAGGRRQLERLTHRLTLSEPEGEPVRRLRAPHLPAGALVVVFSTFLDDQAAQMARLWRQAGHRVLAIDILPRLEAGDLTELKLLAFEILRLERRDRLHELADNGVEVVRWLDGSGGETGPGPAMHLAALARRGRRR